MAKPMNFEEAKKAFAEYDTDGDGFISLQGTLISNYLFLLNRQNFNSFFNTKNTPWAADATAIWSKMTTSSKCSTSSMRTRTTSSPWKNSAIQSTSWTSRRTSSKSTASRSEKLLRLSIQTTTERSACRVRRLSTVAFFFKASFFLIYFYSLRIHWWMSQQWQQVEWGLFDKGLQALWRRSRRPYWQTGVWMGC